MQSTTKTNRYDSRVKAFEVDEKPTEDYSDVGGLDKQINELVEAIVRPMTHKHLFDAIGIKPPKGECDWEWGWEWEWGWGWEWEWDDMKVVDCMIVWIFTNLMVLK